MQSDRRTGNLVSQHLYSQRFSLVSFAHFTVLFLTLSLRLVRLRECGAISFSSAADRLGCVVIGLTLLMSFTHGTTIEIEVMEFWFHCNYCTRRPESWTVIPAYRLTNCGHILCTDCAHYTDTVKICKFCQRVGVSIRPIDRTLPFHIQKFFMPPKVLMEAAEKRIREAIAFQNCQKNLMERCLIRKIVQLWNQLQAMKLDLEAKSRLEKEVTCLKDALKYVRNELFHTISKHQEFEKQALQWGFKVLSIKERLACFCADIYDAVINKKLAENGQNFLQEQGTEQFPNISDEPLDLSIKKKVDSVNENLSGPASNSHSAKCATVPPNNLIGTVLSKKDRATGVKKSRGRKNIASSNTERADGSGSTRRKRRREDSDNKLESESEDKKWVATVAYPTLILRRISADATTTANDE
ncbi:putative integral membrane protein [Acanthocheilonema viteae]